MKFRLLYAFVVIVLLSWRSRAGGGGEWKMNDILESLGRAQETLSGSRYDSDVFITKTPATRRMEQLAKGEDERDGGELVSAYRLHLVIEKWGFSASRNTNETIQPLNLAGRPFYQSTLYSNELCVTQLRWGHSPTNAPPKGMMVESGLGLDVLFENGLSAQSFLPKVLTPVSFKILLENLRIDGLPAGTNSGDGKPRILVKGVSDGNGWSIWLSPGNMCFPVEVEVAQPGGVVVNMKADFSEGNTTYIPNNFEWWASRNGKKVFQENYRNLKKLSSPTKNGAGDVFAINPGAIVTDRRYGNSFTYTMGIKFPSEKMLRNMSKDPKAIEDYQKANGLMQQANIGAFGEHKQSRWIRWIFITVVMFVSGMFFYLSIKHRNISP